MARHLSRIDSAKRDEKILELAERGVSHEVIAERFGISRGMVSMTISRLRKRIARTLEEMRK